MMLYLFGGCLQSEVKTIVSLRSISFNYPKWKKDIRSEGALYRNSKLYLYSQYADVYPLLPQQADISVTEANLLKAAAKFPPLDKHLRSLAKDKYKAFSLKEMDSYFGKVLSSKDIKSFTNSFVYEKMRFLTSYGHDLPDLAATLLAAAYFSFLKQYPHFENYAHLFKLAKHTIHNAGINIIKAETSPGRNRLVQSKDGTYSSLVSTLSENGLSYDFAENPSSLIQTSYLVTGLDGAVQSEWEKHFSLRQLIKSPKLTDLHRQYLKLMINERDPNFVTSTGETQDSLYERDFDQYRSEVESYLGVPAEMTNNFLSSLKKHL
jgi:hypothetical protein